MMTTVGKIAVVRTRDSLCVLLIGTWVGAGCASSRPGSPADPNVSSAPVRMICQNNVAAAEVIRAAEQVLTRMYFAIEKLDVEQGIVKTRPLRGGQFFEFWRSDNASPFSGEEANVQSIRRSVELRVRPEAGGRRTEDGNTPRLCVECDVSVQRLSLPKNRAAGSSQAYEIHSQSAPTLQRSEVPPSQRQAMSWIDLGRDRDLAAGILTRVEQRLERVN